MKESFSFIKGINLRKSPLYLADGEMVSCSNFSFEHEGVLECREAKTISTAIDTTATSKINKIHRYIDSILASSKAYCAGSQSFQNYMYQRDKDASAYTNIDILGGNGRPSMVDFELFIFAVDGQSRRAYIDDSVYEWGVANPEVAPDVAAGAAGNPNATHTCKYTFYVEFPNGKVYETSASPSASVVLASQKCEWSGIGVCPYSGDDLLIYRNLYRDVSGVSYLVATINDNTTQSYSDNVSDSTLQGKTVYPTTNYDVPPVGLVDIVMYLQRIFGVKDNTLYWSEPYIPFGFKTTNSIVVTKDDEDLVGLIDWGDQLFIVSKERWFRLQGQDVTSWAIKRTFTDNGVINKDTIERTKWGILGLNYDGVYVFDGYVTRNLTEQKLGREFFTELDDLDVCFSDFDGEIYHLHYASTGSTVDSCLRIDLSNGMANPEFYNGDYVDAQEFYREDGTRYQALNGYEYTVGGTETIATSVVTGDRVFSDIGKLKNLEYLYYECNTNGIDLTVTFYIDGTAAWTMTLNNSSRVRARSQKLPQLEGYRFALGLSCADSSSLEIYSPWLLEATPVGD